MLALRRCCRVPTTRGVPNASADAFGELRYRFGHGGAGNSDGEFIAAQTRHDPGTGDLGLQPLGHGTQHAIAAGVPEHVVDLLKSVEANDQQRHLTGVASRALKIITDRQS